MVQETINWTLDKPTHNLLKVVARKEGLSMIDVVRTLVVEQADLDGCRIPKGLQIYLDGFGE